MLPFGAEPSVLSPALKNVKVRIYKTIILPAVLYGCETWSLTVREEHKRGSLLLSFWTLSIVRISTNRKHNVSETGTVSVFRQVGGHLLYRKNQKLAFPQAMFWHRLWKVQKLNSNECYTPSSEPFRMYKRGCLRTGCWGEYLDQRGIERREGGESCITRSFIICTLRQV
jgi:hypothetical protein